MPRKQDPSAYAVMVYAPLNGQTAFEITGSGFGRKEAGSVVEFSSKGQKVRTVGATDASVILWKDDRITLKFPSKISADLLRVTTALKTTEIPINEAYDYEWFSVVSNQPGSQAPPLAVAVDPAHRVWIIQEFHTFFNFWDPATGRVRQLNIPRPSDEVVLAPIDGAQRAPQNLTRRGPFASIFLGKNTRTPLSQVGEDMKVDSLGYVWFTQGGGNHYTGEYPNKSRIVRYDPDAPEGKRFRVFTLPGDNQQIIGLAFDQKRKCVWFTTSAHAVENYIENGKLIQMKQNFPAKIVSFDPEQVPFTTGREPLDYSRASKQLICKEGESDALCYREYPVPGGEFSTIVPAHVAVDGSGFVWYTAYWGGNYLGRLDPKTGKFERYPLSKPVGTSAPVNGQPVPFGAGPWEITRTVNGDIAFTEYFDSTVARLRMDGLGEHCQQLNREGKNPCIDEWVVPDANLNNENVHSLALDAKGNVWFTQGAKMGAPNLKTSVGYVTRDWGRIVKLPPLSLLVEDFFSGAGIAVDPGNNDVWFADYDKMRIGRLRKR